MRHQTHAHLIHVNAYAMSMREYNGHNYIYIHTYHVYNIYIHTCHSLSMFEYPALTSNTHRMISLTILRER